MHPLFDPDGWPHVMGVLNVTPDSFSDGGRYTSVAAVVAAAREMVAAGAAVIDVGGESTRPGSSPVPEAEQLARVVPVLRAIRSELDVTLSIDTTRAAVASAALDSGAGWVNDISAGRDDPGLLPLVAARGVPVVLMHMQGTPLTMQNSPRYGNVVTEVRDFLTERRRVAVAAGIDPARVLLDPGIGFGKTLEHNLQLMKRLDALVALGQPVVIGTSRKGFIARVTGEAVASDRLFGTAATVAWAAAQGVAIVRVHDVGPMAKVAAMIRAIRTGHAPGDVG